MSSAPVGDRNSVPAVRLTPKPEANTRAGPDVTILFCTKQHQKPPVRGLDCKSLPSPVITQKPQALEPFSLDQYLLLIMLLDQTHGAKTNHGLLEASCRRNVKQLS